MTVGTLILILLLVVLLGGFRDWGPGPFYGGGPYVGGGLGLVFFIILILVLLGRI